MTRANQSQANAAGGHTGILNSSPTKPVADTKESSSNIAGLLSAHSDQSPRKC